jgi:hypothetical protein
MECHAKQTEKVRIYPQHLQGAQKAGDCDY